MPQRLRHKLGPLEEFAEAFAGAGAALGHAARAGARALHPRRAQSRGAGGRVPAGLGAAAPAHELPGARRARPAARDGPQPRRAEARVGSRAHGGSAAKRSAARGRRALHRLDHGRSRRGDGDRSAAGRRWWATRRCWTSDRAATASRCRCSIRRRTRAGRAPRWRAPAAGASRFARRVRDIEKGLAKDMLLAPLKEDIVAASLDRDVPRRFAAHVAGGFRAPRGGGPQPRFILIAQEMARAGNRDPRRARAAAEGIRRRHEGLAAGGRGREAAVRAPPATGLARAHALGAAAAFPALPQGGGAPAGQAACRPGARRAAHG